MSTIGNRCDGGGDSVRPRLAKISFSGGVKLNSAMPVGGGFDAWFARMAEIPRQAGIIMDRVGLVKTERNLSVQVSWHADDRRTSRRRRHLALARVADTIDPGTKEQVEDVAQDVKEDAEETAQRSRVPIPPASLPYVGIIGSLAIKNLVCGIFAGAAGATAVSPFGVVRTRAIVGQGGQSPFQVINTVVREEGLQAIFQGSLKLQVIKNAIERGLQFTTYESVKRYQERNTAKGRQKKVFPLPRQIPISTAGGAAAGLVGTLTVYPLQPISDRILVQPEKYKSMAATAMQILRNEGGIRELYRGITPALIAIVPTAALSFYTYETVKTKVLPKSRLPPPLEAIRCFLIGGIAGAVSTAAAYPLELARKEILLSTISKRAVHFAEGGARYSNTWQALNGIAQADGWRGLYRGLSAQTLQIGPMTAITFMAYELAKRAFVAEGEESRDEILDLDDVKK